MSSISFNESLILNVDEPMTDQMVLSVMTDYLCEKGMVKDTYKQAILEREQSFPTGLKTGGVNVAIPHADICHVNEAAICVAVLKTPAPFRAMDEPDNDVPVSLVIMLALTEPHGHIEMLQRIVQLIQNQNDVKHIVESGQPEIIHKIIEQYLLKDGN